MLKIRWILVLIAGIVLVIGASTLTEGAAGQTVGLFQNDPGAYNGYTLFAPNRSNVTYLINNDGEIVNTWTSAFGRGLRMPTN